MKSSIFSNTTSFSPTGEHQSYKKCTKNPSENYCNNLGQGKNQPPCGFDSIAKLNKYQISQCNITQVLLSHSNEKVSILIFIKVLQSAVLTI